MGTLGESVKQATIKKLGRTGWKQMVSRVDRLWSDIEKKINKLSVPFDTVRVYQDGLPVSGRELEIVNELANSGSHNYKLLSSMINKGAVLMGTESPELLLEEYNSAKDQFGSSKLLPKTKVQEFDSSKLLEKRDKFIANIINDTLCLGETGIIFIGAMHNVKPWIAKDITITYAI
jgi:hypothetical protein